MKLPTIIKRKKLRAATTARRSRGGLAAMDYEEMGEPNMKLSRALLIVLLLHIVAVAGIIAFNTIKTRETVNATSGVEPAPPPAAIPAAEKKESVAASDPNEIRKVTATAQTKLTTKALEPKAEKAAKAEEPAKKITTIADSGKIYTVVRGDNPVTIAHHFHVDYAALLELNQITDPRKLQIGTKLHIPEREESGKHKSD
jgi:LysM repeat protein